MARSRERRASAHSLFWQSRHSSGKSRPPSMKRCLFPLLVLLGFAGQNRAVAQLTAADVQLAINQAVSRAVAISPNSVIAVADREGYVLGVWVVRGGAATPGEI